jgi:hypothetical protein
VSRYKLTLRCNNFKHGPHKYSRTVDVDEAAGESIDDVENPPCPLCKKLIKKREQEVMGTAPIAIREPDEWLPEGKAPATIGRNNMVKAVDMAADIAMKDYGLTDLKSDARQGETMAPSLPPAQQKLADNFFNPAGNPAFGSRRAKQMQRLGQKAIAGAFRSTALDVKSVLPDSRVALRRSHVEQLNPTQK